MLSVRPKDNKLQTANFSIIALRYRTINLHPFGLLNQNKAKIRDEMFPFLEEKSHSNPTFDSIHSNEIRNPQFITE